MCPSGAFAPNSQPFNRKFLHFNILDVATFIVITYICAVKIEQAIQQKRFDNAYQKLAINLMYTSSQLSIQHQRFFREYGLTMQQYNVMRILRGQKGQPIGVNSLADRMIDQTSNASRLVEKLRQKGLVVREVCKNDRRQAEVSITEKGLELLSAIDNQLPGFYGAFNALSEDDANQLNLLLDRLRESQLFNTNL